MPKLLSLFNIQRTIRNLSGEYEIIEKEIQIIDAQRSILKRRLNSINDGIKYLSRLENDTIKAEEKKKKKGK